MSPSPNPSLPRSAFPLRLNGVLFLFPKVYFKGFPLPSLPEYETNFSERGPSDLFEVTQTIVFK
jgi:hypothetical protein